MKRYLLAVLAVFVAWSVMDFVIHGIILASAYASSPQLWRPMAEMKTGLLYFTTLVHAGAFVYIYARFVKEKGISTGILFGFIYGLGAGISMGYGSFSVMPLPYAMAFVWFVGSVIEATVGGLIAAMIVKVET